MKRQKKLGLALGSGSALGFAHIGVLQVLIEEGIPIHCIAGSSMGAVIGGVYAAGSDLNMLCRIIPELNEQNYFDIAMPRKGGFLLGKRFQDLIALFTKHYTFSQTKLPFACVAVELHSGEVVTIATPTLPLDEGIRASMSIPMVFRPHSLEEQTLVDGGLLVRVPGAATRNLGAEIVVGVDVGYRGWYREEIPESMFSYASFVSDIALWEVQRRREMAGEYDLMIVPDVRNIDPNSFSGFEKAVQAGREATTAQLPALRAALA